jgi:hypothetical protein
MQVEIGFIVTCGETSGAWFAGSELVSVTFEVAAHVILD